MKAVLTVLGMCLIVCLAATHGSAQTCGDADSSGLVTLGDVVRLLDYIGYGGPPLDNPEGADCDRHFGITIGDVRELSDYVFLWGGQPECPPNAYYSFAPSTADTVFIPRMSGILDGINDVRLDVYVNLDDSTRGLYLPYLRYGAGSNTIFEIDSVEFHRGNYEIGLILGANGLPYEPDSSVLMATFGAPESPDRTLAFTMCWHRRTAGIGNIAIEAVDRDTLWRVSVSNGVDGDLYVPTIVYYDVEVPIDTLHVSETVLAFEATEGEVSPSTFDVDFTAVLDTIAFSLEVSDSWIELWPPQTDLITPATVTVTADATDLTPGIYTGDITITGVSPSNTIVEASTVSVTFTVHQKEPVEPVPGDIDCDGVLTIGDLTVMIYYLFINPGSIPPCEY